jgi:3-isopropylmalate dehydrogenase
MDMTSNRLHIAVLPGDGIGPEVIHEAVKVLNTAAARFGIALDYTEYDIGGERYLRTGEILPETVLKELASTDAILFGSLGRPDVEPGILERGIILKIRFALDQYINLRPVKLFPGVETPLAGKGPDDIDMIFVRENTEGLYVGSGGFAHRDTAQEVAIQTSINTRFAIERCVRYAFSVAARRPRRSLTLVGKTNVLQYAQNLWERVFKEVAAEYPSVITNYVHVDACCMWMVKNPEMFDVAVTDNIFGDIITDLGAIIQGGLGLAAGGNINPEGVSMFEPIGGSAPKYTGQHVVCPLAAISAGAMLLEHKGFSEPAAEVMRAVAQVAGDLPSLAAGRMGMSTIEVGDCVAKIVA